ncbi:MBL fold metallo-hydrolase [Herbiconiux moechotypicola]|uniref:MBL fold metallo-hydrolase n=1 Tax=Herbiconiux moechotypicola TaxID=637393 RepID=A0ABN3DEI1_9MICO|nr:MBL fold metallo-hydrolase [Herbiconiux moechotypicola]MCS5729319.1 MBL fold metallo-hydrolase [Herbiconiux moechotypicola]
METLKIGQFTITVIDDGIGHLPPSMYPGSVPADFDGVTDQHGTVTIRAGAFLVEGPHGTVLVDAGAGVMALPFPDAMTQADELESPPDHLMKSGRLPESLRDAGVEPTAIDAVLITHLHSDHVGWIMTGHRPTFGSAIVYYPELDWPTLVDAADPADPGRIVLEHAAEAGILRPYPSADAEILPGIRAVTVPGHTPGSVVVELASEGQKLWFTGDLIELPAQLQHDRIHFATDADRGAAGEARTRLLREAREGGVVIVASHLMAPTFRLIGADGDWVDAAAVGR